ATGLRERGTRRGFVKLRGMNFRSIVPALGVLMLCASLLGAGDRPAPAAKAAPDPQIVALVKAVSAARLRSNDEKLVGFFTRNDFSETISSATRGVFAARDWIRSQFEDIARGTGGRMT